MKSLDAKKDSSLPSRTQQDNYKPGSWQYEVAVNLVNGSSPNKASIAVPADTFSERSLRNGSYYTTGSLDSRDIKGKRPAFNDELYTPPPTADGSAPKKVLRNHRSNDAFSKRSSGTVTFDETAQPPAQHNPSTSLHQFGVFVDERFGLEAGQRAAPRNQKPVNSNNATPPAAEPESTQPRPLRNKTSRLSENTSGNRSSGVGLLEIECAPVPWEPDPIIPIGSVLFLFGFIFPPFWWIGAFFPRRLRSKLDYRWRKINRYVSYLSIVLILGIIGVVIWYFKTHTSS